MFCTYCGAPHGDTADHVVPMSVLSSVHRSAFSGNGRGVGQTVPCCLECNVLLGSKLLLTVPDRAAFLAKRLAVRYRKLLSAADWTEEELAEVGPGLRVTLRRAAAEAAAVRARIENCLCVAASGRDAA